MKRWHTFFRVTLCLIFLATIGHAQYDNALFINGITLELGLGNYSVKDEYISSEKYSGSMPCYRLSWRKTHKQNIYSLDLEFRESSKIENNNVQTEIQQFTMNQGFLYPIGVKSLFGKKLHIYLGPATDLFYFYNKPDIAVSGFDYAKSYAGLFSAGINSEIICPISKTLQTELSLRLSLLSLGFRSVDEEEDDEDPAKLLTIISGTNAAMDIGARYRLIDRLSLKLSYRAELARISGWETVLSASDNIIAGITFSF